MAHDTKNNDPVTSKSDDRRDAQSNEASKSADQRPAIGGNEAKGQDGMSGRKDGMSSSEMQDKDIREDEKSSSTSAPAGSTAR